MAEVIAKHSKPTVVEVWNPPPEAVAWIKARNLECEKVADKLFVYPEAGDVFQRELAGRFTLDQVIVRRGTLEDVFLRLTGRDLRE